MLINDVGMEYGVGLLEYGMPIPVENKAFKRGLSNMATIALDQEANQIFRWRSHTDLLAISHG